jgi:hypothetical protein
LKHNIPDSITVTRRKHSSDYLSREAWAHLKTLSYFDDIGKIP